MSEHRRIVDQVENEWLKVLHRHIDLLYHNTHLPSHDVEHHLRVWNFCRDLMYELDLVGIKVDRQTLEGVLIASLFHDTGLIVDKSEEHGYQSRLYCEQFFKNNSDRHVANLSDILTAIERHDDKKVKCPSQNGNKDLESIHSIVSAADDLDAFGYIGILRYVEIYLIRGISVDLLPKAVIKNLQNRFTNFQNSYSFIKQFVHKHRARFEIAFSFFECIEKPKVTNKGIANANREIVCLLKDCLIERKMDIFPTIDFALNNYHSQEINNFFCELRDELRSINNQKW
jgi:HD superfamily phosphodiesterase